jgi:hypothetical protein
MAEVTYREIELLGEQYFDVYIYEDDQEDAVEQFCSYGSVWDIVGTMDATCESLGYDVEKVAVAVSYDLTTLVYGFHAAGPDGFEIVCESDAYEELVNELGLNVSLGRLSQLELDELIAQLHYVRHTLGQMRLNDKRIDKAGKLIDGMWHDVMTEQVSRLS